MMRRPAVLVVLAAALMIVGGALLKGFGDQGTSDPIASVDNGAPRGLLGLSLLLAARGYEVKVVRSFDETLAVSPADVVLVAPPERSAWIEAEVAELMAFVGSGARLVIACDDEEQRTARLKSLLLGVGVDCVRADVAIGDEAVTKGMATVPGPATAEPLFVRGTGRVKPKGGAPTFPAWTAGADTVVMKRSLGIGSVTVLGTATLIANDGLAKDANAAFILGELALMALAEGAAGEKSRGRVIIDERHHRSRSRAAVVSAAEKGWGPLTALGALALLIPLSLLALVPRPGDPPRVDEEQRGAPAAEASARALAALLVHAAEGDALTPGRVHNDRPPR